MHINKFPRYLRGAITFEINADKSEEFLNECAKNKLDLFGICRRSNALRIGCLVSTYKKIQKLKIAGARRKIINKHGIRFTIHKYRYRSGILVGAILMTAFLILLSGYVWDIDVIGNERLSTNVILDTLKECGFYEGEKKRKFNITEIENQMMIKLPDLSRISINLDGSFAHVEVKERFMPPVAEDVSKPSNLVASMDGRILKMEIVKGKPMVLVGSGVAKGELLVAGFYNDKKDNLILEHSSGKVTAECQLNKIFKLSRNAHKQIGKEERISYSLEFFGKETDLSFGKAPKGSEWQTHEKRKELNILGLKFPVCIIEKRYERLIFEKTLLTDKEGKQRIKDEIVHFEKSELYEAQITKKHTTWISDDKFIFARVSYTIITDIAEQQYIESD